MLARITSMNMPEFYDRPKDKQGAAFTFDAPDFLENIHRSPHGKCAFVGTALSSFQQEPLVYRSDGQPVVTSDWSMGVIRNLRGDVKGSHILKQQDAKAFPNFMARREDYIRRSQELGQNMFRFSLEFDRLCPQEGTFNEELMLEYVKTLALIRARGQEPMLALYHWPMPSYLLDLEEDGDIAQGGWEHPDVIKHFRFYIQNVAKFLADKEKVSEAISQLPLDGELRNRIIEEGPCTYFLSINEPASIIVPGYVAGVFPPYKRARFHLLGDVTDRLIEAHDIAYNIIKSTVGGQVGIGHAWTYFDGMIESLGQSLLPYLSNEDLFNRFERDGHRTDFLGFQYYFRMMPSLSKKRKLYGEHTDFGDVYPPGIYENLRLMHQKFPKKNLFITEFGFAESTDLLKPYLLLETVRYVMQALAEGMPIKSMLLWTLADNFEWAHGMNVRFGLFTEEGLREPLVASTPGTIRSWEAWEAATRALTNPTSETLGNLERAYETAKKQFEATFKSSAG